MDALSALNRFLDGVLTTKRERYTELVNRPKGQSKFLRLIYHHLKPNFDERKRIDNLLRFEKPVPGFRFAPPSEFGIYLDDIRPEVESIDSAFLIVSETGEIGILSPESKLDERAIYENI